MANKKLKVGNVPNLRFSEFVEEWKRLTIGNILTIGSGRDYKHLSAGAIPVYGTGGYMISVSAYLHDGESVCIGRKGTINKPLYLNEKFWTVDTLFYTHSFKKVLPKFVYNIFEQVNWLKYNEASGVPSLSKTIIEQIEVNIPEINEQQKIASFLALIDERIQTQNKIIEELKRLKASLMQKIFSLHFRFKDENGSDFPDWEEKKLEEVVEFRNGKAHENDIDENGKYIVVNSKFISQNGNIRKYSNECNMPLYKDEIVMVMSDVPNGKALAKCFLINKNDKYTLNQRICALKAVSCHNPFLYYLINRNEYYLAFDSGVGQTNLKKDEVLSCPLIVPSSIIEQMKIAGFLSQIDEKIKVEQQLLNQYETQKKHLLKEMFV